MPLQCGRYWLQGSQTMTRHTLRVLTKAMQESWGQDESWTEESLVRPLDAQRWHFWDSKGRWHYRLQTKKGHRGGWEKRSQGPSKKGPEWHVEDAESILKEREAIRISSQRVTQSELSLRNITPLVDGRGNEPLSETATKIRIQSDKGQTKAVAMRKERRRWIRDLSGGRMDMI